MTHPDVLEEVRYAARVLRAGGLVAMPTETVYGLAARARDQDAVRRLYAVKGRPADHPSIVHIGSAAQMADWAAHVPAVAHELAAAFWPGPLTLVLARRQDAPAIVSAGQDTIALRVPNHPLALAVLHELGDGLAAPSANRFGAVSPTTADHVRAELGQQVDLILDGGPCRVGVESTIVDVSTGQPALLRPGGVSREALEAQLGRLLRAASPVSPRVPGSLASHYAPRARLHAVPAELLEASARARLAGGENVVVLAAQPLPGIPWIELAAAADARASRLYAALREVDAGGYSEAFVALESSEAGLGLAIDDRLRRASAPR